MNDETMGALPAGFNVHAKEFHELKYSLENQYQ